MLCVSLLGQLLARNLEVGPMVQKVGHEWCRTALKHNAGLPASQVLFLMHACVFAICGLFIHFFRKKKID